VLLKEIYPTDAASLMVDDEQRHQCYHTIPTVGAARSLKSLPMRLRNVQLKQGVVRKEGKRLRPREVWIASQQVLFRHLKHLKVHSYS
jgi:hypothetical protein